MNRRALAFLTLFKILSFVFESIHHRKPLLASKTTGHFSSAISIFSGWVFFFQQPTISKETHSKPYLHLSWRTAPLSKGAINEKLECRWTNSLTRSIKELVRGESQLGAGDWAINRTLDVSRWPAGRRSDIIIPCAIPPPPIPIPYQCHQYHTISKTSL